MRPRLQGVCQEPGVDAVGMLLRAAGSAAVATTIGVTFLGLLGMQGAYAGPVTARLTEASLPAWEAGYSERYPGCVSMPLWPVGEVPVALVTRTAEGVVARVPVRHLQGDPRAAVGEAAAIGACR